MANPISVKVARFGCQTAEYLVAQGETVGSLLKRQGWDNIPKDWEVRLNGQKVTSLDQAVKTSGIITVAQKVGGGS